MLRFFRDSGIRHCAAGPAPRFRRLPRLGWKLAPTGSGCALRGIGLAAISTVMGEIVVAGKNDGRSVTAGL
jgi:hypothetical protein